MLELVIAGSMIAVTMSSLALVMRTAGRSWELVDSDYAALHQMQALVRHIVRATREAKSVVFLSTDGRSLTIELPSGEQQSWRWEKSPASTFGSISFDSTQEPAKRVLAEQIHSFQIQGFDADGVTLQNQPDQIHVLKISAGVVLPDSFQPNRSVSSKVWIRSW